MPQIFTNQIITLDGQGLIAQATAANPISWVDALSKATVPTDPADPTLYSGLSGTVDGAAVSGLSVRTARIVVAFGNTSGSSAQAVKAIAVRAKLASQSDSEAVIFAYCTDAASTITFPPSTAPKQVTRFAFNIAIQPAESFATVTAGDATLADLQSYVSAHLPGQANVGEPQNIYGAKTFKTESTFEGGFMVSQGAATIDSVDGACLSFQEDGAKFGYIGYEVNGGGLVLTGRESGANNCESIIFGYTSDLDDNPNDPSYFMKMITNADNRDEAWVQVQAACVVPDTSDENSHDLGTTDFKWSNAYIKNIYSDWGLYFENSSNCIEWDGESKIIDVKVDDNLFMEFEGTDQEIYFSMPIMPKAGATVNIGHANHPWDKIYGNEIITQGVNGSAKYSLKMTNGHYITFNYSDSSQSIAGEGFQLDFGYDSNLGYSCLWLADVGTGDPIVQFSGYEVEFQVKVNASIGIKMPHPTAEGELKLGCPCVLKATNGAQTAIKMGDVLTRDSSGWNIIRGNSTIASVALYCCDFSGGNGTFINPLNYAATCRISVLSSAASGAPFLAMMIE